MHILITGASGFVGRSLAARLREQHDVVGFDIRPPVPRMSSVIGRLEAPEDVAQLDQYTFDAVVHLAGVTGGCSERDGLLINVEGTRTLIRYCVDRGCKKFVLASSTAVVGFQNIRFRPSRLPFADEAPCQDRDGYGFSKYLMEQVAYYYHRQCEDLDVIALRPASIHADGALPALRQVGPLCEWAIGKITVIALSDAIEAFALAIEAPFKPGVRVMNLAPPQAWVRDPVTDILRNWYGNDVDTSYFEQPGRERASLYDVRKIERELGFVARVCPPATDCAV